MNDIELIKKLAGVNEKNHIEELKKWANAQLTNQPKIENQAPCPTINDFIISEIGEIKTSEIDVKQTLLKNLQNKGIQISSDILNSIKITEIKGE